jgi:hypothetical protein
VYLVTAIRSSRSMWPILAIGLCIAVGVVLAVGFESSSQYRRFAASEVRKVARQIGRREGDKHPTEISEVRSTNERATSLISKGRTGGVSEPYLAVEVITMHGHFTIYTSSSPPGAHYPRGTWLTLLLDAKTGEIIATNSSDERPPLERLGKVTYMGRRR